MGCSSTLEVRLLSFWEIDMLFIDSKIFYVVLRESSNKKYGMKRMLYLMWKGKNKYYGAKVTINVWEPKIHQQYEFTFSHIWLLSDLFRKYLDSIKAGWQVHSVNF
ncbi:hypothetical protein Bca4012_097526 [Brassica carinata]